MKTKKRLQISAAVIVLGAGFVQKATPDTFAFKPVEKETLLSNIASDVHGNGCACAYCCGIQKGFTPRR